MARSEDRTLPLWSVSFHDLVLEVTVRVDETRHLLEVNDPYMKRRVLTLSLMVLSVRKGQMMSYLLGLYYCDVDRLVDESAPCLERMILRSYDDTNGIFVMEKLLSVEKQVENQTNSRYRRQCRPYYYNDATLKVQEY